MYQAHVALSLLEMELGNRETISQAAVKIDEATKESIRLVQEYFEAAAKAWRSRTRCAFGDLFGWLDRVIWIAKARSCRSQAELSAWPSKPE